MEIVLFGIPYFIIAIVKSILSDLIQFFDTHTNLRHFSIFAIESLYLWYIGCIIFYILLLPSEDKYKMLRRDWRFLKAFLHDVDSLSKSGEEIDRKARQLWNSELIPRLTTVQPLQDRWDWVKDAKKVVSDADNWITTFERLSKRREFPVVFYSVVVDLLEMVNLRYKKIIRKGIDTHVMNKNSQAKGIHESLEISRSKVRSPQDTPMEKQDPFTVSDKVILIPPILKKLNNLSAKEQDLMHGMEKQRGQIQSINLLVAFLNDLAGHRFESEMEKAWVMEAEEIIDKAQHDIQKILKKANGISWLSHVNYYRARSQLKKSSNYIETMMSELLRRKELYGFAFIRRVPSRSVHRPPPQQREFPSHSQVTNDTGALSVVDSIRSLLNRALPIDVSDQLKLLYPQLEHVQKLFTDAKAVEGMKHSKTVWSDEIKNIATDADKSLKSYNFQSKKRQKTDPSPKFLAEIGLFKRDLKLLEECIKVCRIELRKETNLEVGLEEDIHEVISRLTSSNGESSILSIVGMEGIGKTTQPKAVYKDIAIQNHFNKFRYWVPLPDVVSDDNVLQVLGNRVLSTDEERNEKDYWIQKLQDFFKEKRYLVVLDNISTKESWDTLKAVFSESTNESRIVLTTRHKNVALHADQGRGLHQLRLRTKDESWDLFRQIVDYPEQPSEVVKITASKVVERCGGLPLSIFQVGSRMSGKKVTYEELSRLLARINDRTQWSDTLDINEKDLPSPLGQCLSYFGLFPKDFNIPRRRLLALWVAEGLAKPIEVEQKPLESVADNYLKELIDRNLVQVVERKLNGDVKTCKLPSTVREIWLQRHHSNGPTSYLSYSLDHRLAFHFDKNDAGGSHNQGSNLNSPHILRSCRNPCSILLFDTREGKKPGEHVGNFLKSGIASGHLLQLKVLDLERVFRPQLPKTIGKLINLTYLGLRWTYLEEIPSSIGKLLKLQTLDVEHTNIRTLPDSIWKLPKLRHLYMNEVYRSKIKNHPRGNFLQDLQTLGGAFVDEDSPLKDGLFKLTNLRKLALAFQLNLSQQKKLIESMVELKHLESLKLKSIDEMGRPQDLKVKSLSDLVSLSSLYLFGKLHPFIVFNINGLPQSLIDLLPQSLTDLTLSASGLSNDPIPDLEKLLELKSLCLYCDSYIGKHMVFSKGGFPKLLVLKFWMLQELEDWNVEEQAMPNLKQLDIRSCQRLKVPAGLKHLKSLRELKLKNMPLEFTSKITETMEQGDIGHSLAVIID